MHRVGQFVAHVRARVDPSEEALVERVLPPSAQMLFREMPVADRRHGLDVAHRLLASGHDDRDLLAAALLHDAGKGHRLRLWHRVSGVLLEAVAPGALRRLASPDPALVALPIPHLPPSRGDLGADGGQRGVRAAHRVLHPRTAARDRCATPGGTEGGR